MESLTDLDLYRIDYLKLSEFFEQADLARKISGFIQANSKENESKSTWYFLKDFVRLLSLNPKDAKFIITFSGKITQTSLEYICLNPAVMINRMCDQAQKILLTSGTLEPAGDFDLVNVIKHKFSCGHIIPKENFKALCVDDGFDFKFEKRDAMMEKMANLLEYVHNQQKATVGGGIVVFVQSYAYSTKF